MSDRYIALTARLALAIAELALLAALARPAFVAQIPAEPVLTSFIFGLSMTIAIRHALKLLGVPGGDGNSFQRFWTLLTQVGQISGWSLVVGALSL
jgi:MFS superfamily sulfate permease-like transporter